MRKLWFLLVLSAFIIKAAMIEEEVSPTSLKVESFSENISYFQASPRIISINKPDPIGTNESNFIIKPSNRKRDATLDSLIQSLYFLNSGAVMILLDDTMEAHRNARTYMEQILILSDLYIEFLLMKYNSSGVSNVLANSTGQNNFSNYLEWMEPENTVKAIAPESVNGGVMFFAILRALRELPEDSGILIFTDSRINDKDLSQLALKELIEKDVKLFVVWNGVYPTKNNEEKLMTDTAILTGGKFFVSNSMDRLSELYNKFYIQQPEANLSKEVVAFSTNITTNKSLSFPIDSSVTDIHISAAGPIGKLLLTTPENYEINILNSTEVENFSRGSFFIFENYFRQYEIQLYVSNDTPSNNIGIWRLDVDPGTENAQGSNVTVSVQSHLNVTTLTTYKFNSDETLVKVLRVSVAGKYNNIKKIAMIDTWGLQLENNISYATVNKRKNSVTSAEIVEEEATREVDIPIKDLPKDQLYLKIIGEDKKGQTFSRVTYFDTEKVTYLVKPLTIDVSPGSDLITQPGRNGVIFFEVTNNGDRVMFVQFLVQDEKSLLRSLQPRTSWINPRQTVVIKVVALAPYSVSSGSRNLITLTATGPEQARKQVAMYGTANRINDRRPPRLTHRYTSDCTNLLIGNCKDGTWVIEATAEDTDSGLLTLTSIPKGLYFPNPYIAGTKEPVIGIFGGSCCQPKIQLIAIDVLNNRRTYNADAYRASLSAGSISAIVLGSILFIILIVLLIYVICRCRTERQSMDVSIYRDTRENVSTSRL